MKHNRILLGACLVLMGSTGMTLSSCSTSESTEVNVNVKTGDVSNSGCLNRTRAESVMGNPILKLTRKDGNLECELQNHRVNCAYKDVKVDGQVTNNILNIKTEEIYSGNDLANCICPVNVYFTLFNANGREFDLMFNNEPMGHLSFNGHDVTQVDLKTKEQANEEGFDYPLILNYKYFGEISAYNLSGKKDTSPYLLLQLLDNTPEYSDISILYQYCPLPAEYTYYNVEATAEGNMIDIKLTTDGNTTVPSERKGTVQVTFNNAIARSYELRITLESTITNNVGLESRYTQTIYESKKPIELVRTSEDSNMYETKIKL